jgi:hypothetical protein
LSLLNGHWKIRKNQWNLSPTGNISHSGFQNPWWSVEECLVYMPCQSLQVLVDKHFLQTKRRYAGICSQGHN